MPRPARPLIATAPRRSTALTGLLVSVLLGGLTACGSGTEDDDPPADEDFPVTLSSCGREVELDAVPETVVAGSPGVVGTLEALGVGRRVAGYVEDPALPATGRMDGVVAIAPDDLASDPTVADADLFLATDAAQLEDLGDLDVATYVLNGACGAGDPGSIDVLYDDLVALGDAFDVSTRARQLVDQVQERIGAARTQLDGLEVPVGFVRMTSAGPEPVTGSPWSTLVDGLGLTDAFAGSPGGPLDAAALRRAAPEAVFVLAPTGSRDLRLAQRALAGTPAAREGVVVPVDASLADGGALGLLELQDYVVSRVSGD